MVRNYIQTSFSSCAHFLWKNRHFQICYQTYCAFIVVVIWLRDHDDTSTSSSKCEFGGATRANHNHTSYIWTTYFRHSFNVECVSCVVHGHITVERWENLFNISCAVTSCHSCRPPQSVSLSDAHIIRAPPLRPHGQEGLHHILAEPLGKPSGKPEDIYSRINPCSHELQQSRLCMNRSQIAGSNLWHISFRRDLHLDRPVYPVSLPGFYGISLVTYATCLQVCHGKSIYDVHGSCEDW